MPETKTRDSNFELLRIFAMFIIILHHFALYGIFFPSESASQFSFNFFVREILWGAPGNIGNWLFIFTSGFLFRKNLLPRKKFLDFGFRFFQLR